MTLVKKILVKVYRVNVAVVPVDAGARNTACVTKAGLLLVWGFGDNLYGHDVTKFHKTRHPFETSLEANSLPDVQR